MKGKIIKLKNGGVLVYSRSKVSNSTAVEVGFRVGAQCDKKAGTAHFLEHTLFKKTRSRTNEEVEHDRNKIVFLNASTGMDYLIIKFYRTNKMIEKSMKFAADVLMDSVLDDEYVETEKGVIKEELKMCLDEEIRDVYLRKFKQAISEPKVASDIVGGSEKSIDAIKFKDIKNFKNQHFVGNNFVISVVSSLGLGKIKKLVNKIFVPKIPYVVDYKRPQSNFERVNVDKESSLKICKLNQEKTSVLLTFKLNKSEYDIYAKNYNYTFLARYLSGSQGSLFLKLRNQGLIYKLGCDISSFKDTSLFNLNFETSKEKIKQILEIVKDEIHHVVNEKIDDSIVSEYRSNLEFFADEKMPPRMSQVSHVNFVDYLNMCKLFHLTKKQKKNLRKNVTPENVQLVAREIFAKNNDVFVTTLGDATKKDIFDLEWFKENFLISE